MHKKVFYLFDNSKDVNLKKKEITSKKKIDYEIYLLKPELSFKKLNIKHKL